MVQSYAPKSASHMVLYQLGQAIKVEQVDPVLLKAGQEIVAGNWPYEEVHTRLLAQAQEPLERRLNEQAEGLLLALEANGLTAYATGVERLMASWDDPQVFEVRVGYLKQGFQADGQHDYVASLDRIQATYQQITELDDITAGRLTWAVDKAVRSDGVTRETTTEWRRDTDPKLASLLKIKPEHAPRFTELVHVMEAKAADGQLVPGKRYRSDKQSGWTEIRYNAPKSVSVAYAQAASAEERGLILDAHRAAVHASLVEVEKTIAVTRYGEPQRGHMTWALFHHLTARATPGNAPDPHLHTHAYIPNVVLSQEGEHVVGLHGRAMRGHGKELLLGTYRPTLAAELMQRGFDARYIPERRDIELAHIPQELIEQFSKRSHYAVSEARRYLAKQGRDYDALPARDKQIVRNNAVAVTRKSEHGYQDAKPEQLKQTWQAQAAARGFTHTKPGITREGIERGRRYRLEPWMAQTGGVEALSGAHLASARRSYQRWAEDNPGPASKYGFAQYVEYVQARWQANPEQFDERGGRKPGWTERSEGARLTQGGSLARAWGVVGSAGYPVPRPEL